MIEAVTNKRGRRISVGDPVSFWRWEPSGKVKETGTVRSLSSTNAVYMPYQAEVETGDGLRHFVDLEKLGTADCKA